MNRRALIGLLGSAAAWPRTAHAQSTGRVRVIGTLLSGTSTDPEMQARIGALQQGLQALSWTEGRNYRFEMRWPVNNPELIKTQAKELVALAPDIIVAGSALAITFLREASSTIPIVFANVADPVGGGLVASLRGSGGNVTG